MKKTLSFVSVVAPNSLMWSPAVFVLEEATNTWSLSNLSVPLMILQIIPLFTHHFFRLKEKYVFDKFFKKHFTQMFLRLLENIAAYERH